ncbi:sugar ABC transporter ATP-binding protein [Variovorax ginsengisoli]|uniref:Ribose transport system ATP-binding protein n=1 Tax=Variovorax ginsengisoli TaxID=363844 RepID=A0ABT9S1V9_9BURK|nr:sugar ABC transporter ATP-binding protein [Variovorax ginsengisoli]MDP9898330.1 ribose transport system ATP-binding protein [Variovorax ginsengisoli]
MRHSTLPAGAALPVLKIDAVGKDYAAPVLDGVTLTLRAGEALALTGENGAGKSTLSKIICGLVTPTRGHMSLGGQAFAPTSRRDAERQGVRMVMQELGLVATLSVAENLLLDRLPHRAGWLRRAELHALAAHQLAKIGMQGIDPGTPVSALGIGQQQMVEIARNLQDDTRVLVLDEPTAMLTPRETTHLFEQIDLLKAQGVAIIYVSHRLEELQRICDTVAVLRDGRLVDVRPMAGVREADIVERMVGRAVHEHEGRPRRLAGPVVMQAHGIGRAQVVRDVDLSLHAGEVMGLAGLVGSGRTELVRLLFGADRADRGELTLHAGTGDAAGVRRIPKGWRSPMQAIRAGIGLVTEDRKSQGLLLAQSIRVNTTLSDLGAVSRGGWLRPAFERGIARRFVERLRVRSSSIEQPVATLSGGNQQKVVFARWLHRECRVLLLDEPTRGVDVGARADLYAELDRMTDAGRALLMVSSDLRELMAMCDRIGVMSGGRLVAVFERGQWTEQSLLAAAFSDAAVLPPTATDAPSFSPPPAAASTDCASS